MEQKYFLVYMKILYLTNVASEVYHLVKDIEQLDIHFRILHVYVYISIFIHTYKYKQ